MPEIAEVFFNDVNYGLTSKVSPWINVSIANSLIYSVHCNQNCDVVVEWSSDDNPIQIIHTETFPLIANTDVKLHLFTKWRHARFSVLNIASTPCNLKCQLMF
jgi:hypothetical protein